MIERRDRRRLRLIPSLAENPLFKRLVHRQLALKYHNSRSWIIKTQALLYKYELPHLSKVIESTNMTEWKALVDQVINTHWKKHITSDADGKSTLKFLNTDFNPHSSHQVWENPPNSAFEVRRSSCKARMLTGVYIVQATRAAFNQTSNKICLLCGDEEEDLIHLLCRCSTLDEERDPLMEKLLNEIPLVYQPHPWNWPDDLKTQLILDVTHTKVIDIIPEINNLLPKIERRSRALCFKLHITRSKRLNDIDGSTKTKPIRYKAKLALPTAHEPPTILYV